MVRLFDPKEFVMLADGTKVHPHRSILRDGVCCWGDAIRVHHTVREDRQMQIVKTAHRIEELAEALDGTILIVPDSWDGDSVNDTLEFVMDDFDGLPMTVDQVLEALLPLLGPFEKIFAIGPKLNYRRS
jgi:hypothetical protein